MSLKLIIESPALLEAFEILLDRSPVRLGRSSRCEVQIPLAIVSGHHLTFRQRGQGWEVADQGSTNGTRLDGAELTPQVYVPLRDGAELQIMDVRVRAERVASLEEGLTLEDSATMVRGMLRDLLGQKDAEDVATLEVVGGALRGQRFPLHDRLERVFVGAQAGALVRMREPDAPERALIIERDEGAGGFTAHPVEGVALRIDGAPVQEPRALASGQRLEAAGVELLFVDPVEAMLAELEELAPQGAGPTGAAAPEDPAPLADEPGEREPGAPEPAPPAREAEASGETAQTAQKVASPATPPPAAEPQGAARAGEAPAGWTPLQVVALALIVALMGAAVALLLVVFEVI